MPEINLASLKEMGRQLLDLAVDFQNEIAVGIAVVAVVTVFWAAKRNALRNQLKQYAPRLQMSSFQISPLGRDGFLKLHNSGEPAILKSLRVLKRHDLNIQDQYKDSRISKRKDYALLIEASGKDRIAGDFLIVLEYADEKGYTYKQTFDPSGRSHKKARYIGRKHHQTSSSST